MDGDEGLPTPVLETGRLLLRPMSREDLDFILRHFATDEVNEFSSFDNLRSLEEAEELFDKYLSPGRPNGFRLGVVLKGTGELVGTLGFYRFSRTDRCAMVGADLSPGHWGQGLMTEALEELIRHGFEEMGLNRIEATTNSRNARSLRLADRLGFRREGVMRQRYFYKGGYQDDVMLSLLRDEWEKGREEK